MLCDDGQELITAAFGAKNSYGVFGTKFYFDQHFDLVYRMNVYIIYLKFKIKKKTPTQTLCRSSSYMSAVQIMCYCKGWKHQPSFLLILELREYRKYWKRQTSVSQVAQQKFVHPISEFES